MSRFVNFSDGQGIHLEDMNALGSLPEKSLGELANRLHNRSSDADALTLLAAAHDWEVITPAARTARMKAALWATTYDMSTGGAGGVDDPLWVIVEAASTNFTFDANATSGYFRRDIIQGKLELAAGVSASRDFEDATTRVKSSSSTNTRNLGTFTYAIKKGTEYATEGAVVEPSADSGYTKLASYLIDDSDEIYWGKIRRYYRRGGNTLFYDGYRTIHPFHAQLSSSGTGGTLGWSTTGTVVVSSMFSGSRSLVVPLPLLTGDRLYKLELRFNCAGSATVSARFAKASQTGTIGLLSGSTDFTVANGDNITTVQGDEFPWDVVGGDSRHSLILFPTSNDNVTFAGGRAWVVNEVV